MSTNIQNAIDALKVLQAVETLEWHDSNWLPIDKCQRVNMKQEYIRDILHMLDQISNNTIEKPVTDLNKSSFIKIFVSNLRIIINKNISDNNNEICILLTLIDLFVDHIKNNDTINDSQVLSKAISILAEAKKNNDSSQYQFNSDRDGEEI